MLEHIDQPLTLDTLAATANLSKYPVQAIAATVGYEDPLYFSRWFSKTIGLSPHAYRASIRK